VKPERDWGHSGKKPCFFFRKSIASAAADHFPSLRLGGREKESSGSVHPQLEEKGRPMLQTFKSFATALHRDERGDMAQIVLAVALIVIPLLLMLIAFGTQIGQWFKDQNSELKGKSKTVPKAL
jgi:hypothetical protein